MMHGDFSTLDDSRLLDQYTGTEVIGTGNQLNLVLDQYQDEAGACLYNREW